MSSLARRCRLAAVLGLYAIALVLGSAITTTRADAQSTSRVGLLVVAHGADSTWNANVRSTVSQVKWAHGPVAVAFLMGPEGESASWSVAVAQLQKDGASRVIAVPLMVSTHGSHVDQIRFYAGELPALPKELEAMHHGHAGHMPNPIPVVTTGALDDAPELGEALLVRWRALSEHDRARPLMLIAHGPGDSVQALAWEKNIARATAPLTRLVAPQPVRIALLRDDAAPEVRANAIRIMRDTISALAARGRDSVMALPVLISTSSINTAKIPADIAGLPVRFQAVGLTPSSDLARWIERIANERRGALAGAR